MAAFTYKKTETTTLKATGIIDTDRMVIDIDGEEKSLSTLLSDFNGACIEMCLKVKNEIDLDEPEENDDDDNE